MFSGPVEMPGSFLSVSQFRHLLYLGAVVMNGCTQVPELNNTIEPDLQRAKYPELIPLDRALGMAPSPMDASAKLEDQLNARRAALQKKARDLNDSDQGE